MSDVSVDANYNHYPIIIITSLSYALANGSICVGPVEKKMAMTLKRF